MIHTDVIQHHGFTHRLVHLADNIDDDEREAIHSGNVPHETHQQWWDRFVERFPESADEASEVTRTVETIWRIMLDSDDVKWNEAGGVVRVKDGQMTWYAYGEYWDAAAEWAASATITGDSHDPYEAFCDRCPGILSSKEESLPLIARYAAAKYDMASEDGRAEALDKVFGGDEDDLADACMLLDMEADRAV